MNIAIEYNPSSRNSSDLGVMSWPKWSRQPGKYALVFEERETCYLVKGKVKVYPNGSSEFVQFGAGDLVTIPKGLSSTLGMYHFSSTNTTSSILLLLHNFS